MQLLVMDTNNTPKIWSLEDFLLQLSPVCLHICVLMLLARCKVLVARPGCLRDRLQMLHLNSKVADAAERAFTCHHKLSNIKQSPETKGAVLPGEGPQPSNTYNWKVMGHCHGKPHGSPTAIQHR